MNVLPNPIVSVFCPDCQGTGVNIEGDEFEKPLTPLSEVWFLSFVHAIVLFFFFLMFFPCTLPVIANYRIFSPVK